MSPWINVGKIDLPTDEQVETLIDARKGSPQGIASLDGGGRVPNGELPERLAEAALSAMIAGAVERLAPAPTVPPADVVVRGDSISEGGPGGIKWSDLLSSYLGARVFNPSVAGEQTRNIAVRGGLCPIFTIAGGQLPAGTEPTPVTLVSPDGGGFNGGDGVNDRIGRFSGRFVGVRVSLKRSPAGIWTMARFDAGEAVSVPAGGGYFFADDRLGQRAAIGIFWGGKNGGPVLQDTRTMVADLLEPRRFLVLSILTSGSEPSGTSGHTAIVGINATLAAEWPENYLDIRRHLIDHGLGEEGIVPTAGDLTDVAGDTVPRSLRADDTHPNAAGQRVIARFLAKAIIDKGWWPAEGSHVPPPADSGLILDLPGGTSRATRASASALQSATRPSVRLHHLTIGSITSGQTYRVIANRWDDAAELSWNFLLTGEGKLFLQYRAAGANATTESSVPLTSAADVAIRFDLDATAGTVTFYTSVDDGATWAQLGVTRSGLPTGSISSAAPLKVGGYQLEAKVGRIRVLDGAAVLVDHAFSNPSAPDAVNWTYADGASLVAV